MVNFMQTGFRQRFVQEKELCTLGGFSPLFIPHEINPDYVNIYWRYLCVYWNSNIAENVTITLTMVGHVYSYTWGHKIYVHITTYHICTYAQVNTTYICIEFG